MMVVISAMSATEDFKKMNYNKEETYLDKTGYAVMGGFIGFIIGHLLTIYSLTIPLGQ